MFSGICNGLYDKGGRLAKEIERLFRQRLGPELFNLLEELEGKPMDNSRFKFRIIYQHGETGRITERFLELGQPIPHLGNQWDVIAKNQYIGLYDSEGKPIYEGDRYHQIGFNGEIVWNRNGFWFKYNKSNYFLDILDSGKITGYIFENKELINDPMDT